MSSNYTAMTTLVVWVHYIDSGDKSYLFTEAYHRTVIWSLNKWLYWNEMIVFCSHAFCVLALKWWICCNLSLWCGSKLYFRGIFRFWIHVSSIFLYFHSLGPNFSTIFSSPGSTIFLTCFYHRKKWSLSYLAFSIAGHFARGYRVEFPLKNILPSFFSSFKTFFSSMQWKNCPSLYSNWQDFETGAAGMCISSYLLLELVSASAWRSRTNVSFWGIQIFRISDLNFKQKIWLIKWL
jgi:hypothetical protein